MPTPGIMERWHARGVVHATNFLRAACGLARNDRGVGRA